MGLIYNDFAIHWTCAEMLFIKIKNNNSKFDFNFGPRTVKLPDYKAALMVFYNKAIKKKSLTHSHRFH